MTTQLRWTQARRRGLMVLRHEWTLAILGGLALAVVYDLLIPWTQSGTFPSLADTLPQDTWDPSLVAYLIAWDGHALLHNPAHLWDLNAFYPAPNGLAFTDSLLGYGPVAMIGSGPVAAVLRYNLIFLGAHALVFVGMYALTRQLGLGRLAAALAGVAVAVAPWRLAQTGHLHVLSTGGMMLCLAMLARGHGVRWTTRGSTDERPSTRPGWALAGWLVGAWQITIGFGVGLPFLYLLLGIVIVMVIAWTTNRRRRERLVAGLRTTRGRRLLAADLGGGAVFAVIAVLMALPYLAVLAAYPYAKRDITWIAFYSPPLRGLFTAPPESFVWGDLGASARQSMLVPGEMVLLPGFVLIILAVVGLFLSAWPRRVRVALAAGVVVSAALSLGTHGPAGGWLGYRLLMVLPGLDGIRTPGRIILWTTVLLALLAAGAIAAVGTLVTAPADPVLPRVALLLPILLVFLEGWPTTPHPQVPSPPAALSGVQAPYLVLPSGELADLHIMLWSTDGFPAIANGGSAFVPTDLARIRQVTATFPDLGSATYLRQLGVRTVVVLPEAGDQFTVARDAAVDQLGMTREVRDGAVILHL